MTWWTLKLHFVSGDHKISDCFRINAMEAYNLLVLVVLGIIGAIAAEDVSTVEDAAIMKNQTEEIEDTDFNDMSNLTADQGNWTVGECIIVKMAAQVKISFNLMNLNMLE